MFAGCELRLLLYQILEPGTYLVPGTTGERILV